jgi:hypothetical protein
MSILFLQPIAAKRAVNSTGTFYPARCYELPIRRSSSSNAVIGVNNETLSVAAMCACNPDCSAFGIHG